MNTAHNKKNLHSQLHSQAVAAYRAQNFDQAFDLCCQAIDADPSNDYSKMLLAHFAGYVTPDSFSPLVKRSILRSLQSPKVAHRKLQKIWKTILYFDPSMTRLKDVIDSNQNVTQVEWQKLQSSLLDPFFTEGLRMMLIRDPKFEKFLINLRKFLTAEFKNDDGFLRNKHLPLLSALSENCFMGEYIFSFTAEEKEIIEESKEKIQKSEDLSPIDICLFGAYSPLSMLLNASHLNQKSWPQEIKSLIKLQIFNPLREQDIKKEIDSISSIENEVSQNVRAMYEENPYPRWRSIDLQPQIKVGITGHYLNAGCGTGQSLSHAAHMFPDVSFQAIDLSSSSLAYAQRMTEEIGLTNISFHLCDLMNADKLKQSFDIIESSGVLHHIGNPLSGLKKLTECLSKGGMLLLGFYSSIARRHIIDAQKYAKNKGYTFKADDIRAFRDEIFNFPEGHAFKSFSEVHDFYSLSECRDLLFHIQEKNYTLLEISDMLDKAGLAFKGFRFLMPHVKAIYSQKFPEDPKLTDLKNWHILEQENPDIFIGMYQFLCCRKDEMPNDTVLKIHQAGFFNI